MAINQKRRRKPSLIVNIILGLGALSILGLLVGVPMLLMRDTDSANKTEVTAIQPPAVVEPVKGPSVDSGEKAPAGDKKPEVANTPVVNLSVTEKPSVAPEKEEPQATALGAAMPAVTKVEPSVEPVIPVNPTPTPADAAPMKPMVTEPVAVTPTPAPPPPATEPVVSTEPAREVQSDEELDRFKQEVDQRISAAADQHYPPEMKDAARETLRRVSGLFKVGTIHFTRAGSAALEPEMKEFLLARLQDPLIAEWALDPQARIIALGFADPTGSAAANQKLSRERAIAVNDFIKGEVETLRTYAFGIGATTVVNKEDKEKNRAVEVWLAVGQAAGGN